MKQGKSNAPNEKLANKKEKRKVGPKKGAIVMHQGPEDSTKKRGKKKNN